jgi:hypothetical protein
VKSVPLDLQERPPAAGARYRPRALPAPPRCPTSRRPPCSSRWVVRAASTRSPVSRSRSAARRAIPTSTASTTAGISATARRRTKAEPARARVRGGRLGATRALHGQRRPGADERSAHARGLPRGT